MRLAGSGVEAPEIFPVLGKRRPLFVEPYIAQLRRISETDENRVVRIHCKGAIKAATHSRFPINSRWLDLQN